MNVSPIRKGTDRRKEVQRFLEKIVVNAGIGRASQMPNFSEKILPQIKRDIALLTGQEPEMRPAKKSIAGFKTREGQIIGIRVTLRRGRMVDFFERLVTIVLPRVRDFTGIVRTSIDEGGVLNIGFKDHVVFPEINPEQSPFLFSLGVAAVPRVKHRARAIEGYEQLGVPLKRK